MAQSDVAICLAPGFEEVEALAPYDVLFRAQISCDLVAVHSDLEVASSHEVIIKCTKSIDEVDLEAYKLLILPGGLPGTTNLKASEKLCQALIARAKANKNIAAICAAPSILAELDLLKDRKATANPGFQQILADNGACLSTESVVRDAHFITSQGAGCALAFGLKILELFCDQEEIDRVAQGIVLPRS